MKTHVLMLVGCLAVATTVRAQNDPVPAVPAAPQTPTPAVPAAPANATPQTPTNAPTAVSPAEVKTAPAAAAGPAQGVQSASTIATNVVAGTNAAEIVPLIVIDDVPLVDAVKNLARQAGLNYFPDPKLTAVTNQPNVTMRLENVTAQDALMAVLETYNLQIIHDPRIKVARITVKDPKAP